MNVEQVVGQIKTIETKIKTIEERHKAELAPFVEFMEKAKNTILNFLNQTGQQNAKTKLGTAYKKELISYRIEDRDAFMRHVIGAADWEALNWSVNKSRADDEFSKSQQLLPGVTRSVIVGLGVLAPPKKRVKVQKNTITQSDSGEITLTEEELMEAIGVDEEAPME